MQTRSVHALIAALTALCLVGGVSLTAMAQNTDGGRFTWGQIVDQETGKPVAGAAVTDPESHTTLTTDESGTFFFTGAIHSLQITRSGYDAQTVALTGPGLVGVRNRLAPSQSRTIAQTGERILLRRTPPPLPQSNTPILPSQLTLSWRADTLTETHTGTDGVSFNGAGPRATAVWLDGGLRLGSALLMGTYTSNWYGLQRSDTGDRFSRLQHQGTLGALFAHRWGERAGIALGPTAILQQITLFNAPTPQNRAPDYLDVSSTRWGAGLLLTGAVVPVPAWPITLDARAGIYPWTWQLTDSVNLAPGGMWSLQGSIGARWFPWRNMGVDIRYVYDGWQTAAYYQGSHGAALGWLVAF